MSDYLMNHQVLQLETMKYLAHPYALNYNFKALASNFSKDVDEKRMIGLMLCGTANVDIAISFMIGDRGAIKPFFENVKYNGEESIPLIIRAINLHLI